MINFPKRVVQCGKTEDGRVGVDYMEKEKIIQDARNMFINVIYITTGLNMAISTYKNFVRYFCMKKTICTLDLHIVHAGVLISFSSSSFLSFFIFFHFLASARMWLAKRSSCPSISCSWEATRLASIVVLLISIAFCFNLPSFS